MAASLVIELESGVIRGRIHRHNGYSSGFFSGQPRPDEDALSGDSTGNEA